MSKNNFEALLFPESPALSPYAVIERFEGFVRKYGKEIVLSDRRFQKAREMWAVAIFLLGRSKFTKETYWLTPSYEEVPDIFVDRFQPHPKFPEKGTQLVRLMIEVTDWDSHSTETLHERIFNKLAGKAYPEYFLLLVHVKKNIAVDLDKEYAEIQKIGLPIMETWILASLDGQEVDRQAIMSMGTQKIGADFSLKTLALENKEIQKPGALLIELHKTGTETEIFPYPHVYEFPDLE